MPVQMGWIVEGHLAYVKSVKKLTMREFEAYEKTAEFMLENATVPLLHTLYDYTDAEELPPLVAMSRMKINKHPRVGWVIFYGVHKPLLKFFISILTQMGNVRLRIVNTEQDALDLIRDIDHTLPPFTMDVKFILEATMPDEENTKVN